MDTQEQRWEALRIGFASLRADLAEVAAEVAELGVERTAAALRAAYYRVTYRLDTASVSPLSLGALVAPVGPVVPLPLPRTPLVVGRSGARAVRRAMGVAA